MVTLLNKNQKKSTPKIKTGSIEASEFIPYCEHYNEHTLVTKNGELMQTIRISKNRDGLNYEQHDDFVSSLRETVRSALINHVQTDNIAIWIHTLRKRQKVSFDNEFSNPFAAYINKNWRKKHGWQHQYFNEVYVTLLYEGQNGALSDASQLKNTIWPSRNREFRHTYLEATNAELNLIMGNVIDSIKDRYQVELLSIVERLPSDESSNLPHTPIYFSQQMEFLSYLLNLRDQEVPLPEASIHNSLQSTDLLIGFNALETKSDDGRKRFAALLSLKNYREMPTHTVDMLLQSPMELIISQAFHFIPHAAALKKYKEQRDIFEVSGDSYSMEATGLADIYRGNHKLPTDYGHQQTSFMVIVDELKQIEPEVGRLQEAFGDIGLVCVREDIRLEEIFWSTLPGNFEFLRRKDVINSHRVAGFARLNRFASGRSTNNLWAQPVALIPTLVNSPYFFNFHVQDNGHTLWLDFNSFNDTRGICALSFLLTQTQKLNSRIYYFDQRNSASLWFNKMGADYQSFNVKNLKNKPSASLNPFSLANEPRNIGFLTAWCAELISATPEERAVIGEYVRSLMESSDEKSLPSFVRNLAKTNSDLAARFSDWNKGGTYGHLFSNTAADTPWSNDWVGLDMSAMIDSLKNALALFSYLMHRIIASLNGAPTIIVMREMLPVLSQPFFASRLESLLEMLKENNAMIIFAETYSPPLLQQPLLPLLIDNCASFVIVPDDLKQEYATLAPSLLTTGDENLLWHMERTSGDILLKQKKETVALRINLDGMEDVTAIFSNDIKTLVSAGGLYAAIPESRE